MNKFLSVKLSGSLLLSLLIILLPFHILILAKAIPYEIVWGGQIDDPSSLLIYEGLALFITIIFILIISMKTGYILSGKFVKVVNTGVWIIFIYFLLNIAGNLTSEIAVEKSLFTVVTIIMAFLAFRLAIVK